MYDVLQCISLCLLYIYIYTHMHTNTYRDGSFSAAANPLASDNELDIARENRPT